MVILDENETYKRYIDNMFINREIDRNMLEIYLRAKKVCKKG